MSASPRILVTHPGRQHSHQAAVALEKEGMLAGYWAGVPSLAEHWGLTPRWLWSRFVRYAPVPLPPARARAFPWVPGLRQIGNRLRPRRLAERVDFAACRLFDRAMAGRLAAVQSVAVVACEISALAIFREARRLGRLTFLDAPSLHHADQDRLHGFSEAPSLHRRIVAVKEAELVLADHVLTVSDLARQTYVDGGVPGDRVHAVPLGADLALFGAVERHVPAGAPVRFLFGGAAIRRKAFDLLVTAFAEVAREHREPHLRHVGPRGELGNLAESLAAGSWSATGPLPQAGWAEELAAADVLVLPSRNDSFGMVVAEALAAGVPVIVSEMVGAKELVVEGSNGWVVPVEDVAALAARMRWCTEHPIELRAMEPACRRSAARATWEAYHERYAALVAGLLDRGRG